MPDLQATCPTGEPAGHRKHNNSHFGLRKRGNLADGLDGRSATDHNPGFHRPRTAFQTPGLLINRDLTSEQDKLGVTRHSMDVLTFDDLVLGSEWESPGRTVTETDVVLFAGLSGDYNPLHANHELSKSGPFGRPVAHGLLGLAIATGLISHAPRVDTMALLAILEWRFLLPIVFGDTIKVVSRVEAREPQARGRRGIVTWHRHILNQNGHVVQAGRTQTLVRGKPRSRPTKPSPSNAGD
jgi:acyl dehydratase